MYLTVCARDILIAHIDGRPVAFVAHGIQHNSIRALVRIGYLRVEPGIRIARHTRITEAGRAMLARALADWAEAIERYQQAVPAKLRKSADSRLHAARPVALSA